MNHGRTPRSPAYVVRVLGVAVVLVVMAVFNVVLDHLVLSYWWVQVAFGALGLVMFAVLLPVYVRQHPRRAVTLRSWGSGSP